MRVSKVFRQMFLLADPCMSVNCTHKKCIKNTIISVVSKFLEYTTHSVVIVLRRSLQLSSDAKQLVYLELTTAII